MDREIKFINNEYELGNLSFFPQGLDDNNSLYSTTNSAIGVITGRLTVGSENIYVNDTSFFPERGIIRINDELIYYRNNNKESNILNDLIRGFNNTSIMNHNTGSIVLGCVSSLHHNSVRDAIVQTQRKTGLISDLPNINGTLTSRVKFLDLKWFTPVARFFALPRQGVAPLTVNFRNFSLGDPYTEYIWDFGDITNTSVSSQKHPVHIYEKPGNYTVTLSIKSSDGRNSLLSKNNYIKVFDSQTVFNPIAYARDPLSNEKLRINEFGRPLYDNSIPFEVEFVDQTLGSVIGRRWNFGDGTVIDVNNPFEHIITHTYTSSGIYWPELRVLDQNDIFRVYKFKQPIIVGLDNQVSYEELLLGAPLQSQNILTRPIFTNNNNLNIELESIKNSLIIG